MAENRRGKENRFYFSRGQMVLLGAAFTFASMIIFVLGVFVGKGIEARKLQQKEEPLVRIPVKPSAQQPGAASAKDEITFNESATKRTAAAAEDKPKAAKPAEKVVKAVETKQEIASKIEAAALKSPEKKAQASAPAEETAKKTETADSTEQKQVWRAQVNAFPDERSAKQIVDRLKNKGYNAYVTEVQNRGKSWFRVSVGKYNSREEADKMAEALRTKENFPKAFAASR
ncbi:MAG: SPOR domain-containing protein [Candidatus Binatia bacterium]